LLGGGVSFEIVILLFYIQIANVVYERPLGNHPFVTSA
jgi:hypothetical protein